MISKCNGGVAIKILTLGSFQSTDGLRAAANGGGFRVVTDSWVVSSAILSGTIAGIGLVFFALFIWKRKTLDPPSYIDLEKANKPTEKGRATELGEKSPEFPIQPANKTSPGERDTSYTQHRSREPWAERMRGHSLNESNASSITVKESSHYSYRETLHERTQSTMSVVSTDSTYRGPGSDYGSKDDGQISSRSREKSALPVYSDSSQYSQTSKRIFINNVPMPPQFSTPTQPLSTVSQDATRPYFTDRPSAPFVSQASPRPKSVPPPRPPRVRGSLVLPF